MVVVIFSSHFLELLTVFCCLQNKITHSTSNLKIIQINHQPDATIFQFIMQTFIYGSTCFGRFLAHHQELNEGSGSLWFLPLYHGDSHAVFIVGPASRSTTVTTIRR
jgi:hypothetical protein